jgi:endo-1,4-beta-xylanase
VYLRKLGPDYIAEAFALAHEADPGALLVYNDYGGEGLNRKSDDVYALVRDLVARGVPIGGVGLQMHLDAASRPPTADIAAQRRAPRGARPARQHQRDGRAGRAGRRRPAREARRAAPRVPRRGGGVPRGAALRRGHLLGLHRPPLLDRRVLRPDDPLLFDDAYGAKPAYQGVLDALRGR